MKVTLQGIPLELLPQRMLYIPDYHMLCLADWHLGKAAHFRKSGIPVPQPNLEKEFQSVKHLVEKRKIRRVLFLGDLFHSSSNNDWKLFDDFIRGLPDVSFTLVKGNHDIIERTGFEQIGVEMVDEIVLDGRILLTHEPLHLKTPPGVLNVAGHIHPGYRLALRARQAVLLPCFHYSCSTLTLPAFGNLTGLHPVGHNEQDEYYCILGDEVVRI